MIYGALIVVLWSMLIANWKARVDAASIARNEPIDHGKELADWAIWVALGYAAGGIFTAVHDKDPRGFYLYLPLAWSAFTPSFRWLLNRKRRLDWRYVSPSSAYDRAFLGYGPRSMSFWDMTAANSSHAGLYGKSNGYTREVHRAGTLAYAFEALVFTASLVLITIAHFKT